MKLCQCGSVMYAGEKITYVLNKDTHLEYSAEVSFGEAKENETFISDKSAKQWIDEQIALIFEGQGWRDD